MTKTSKIILWILAIIIVIGLIWIGITNNKQPIGEGEIIKIGAILPLTGKASGVGEDMKQGIDLAFQEINKDGQKMELVYEDEKCDAKEAVTAYNNLVSIQGVKIIIGAGCSPSTLAIAPLAEKDKVVLITTSSSAPAVSDAGDYIFRNHGNSDFEFIELAKKFAKKLKTVAVLYDLSNDYSISGQEAFINEWEKQNGEIKTVISYQGDSSDYKTELTKIKSNNDLETIMIIGLKPIILLKQYRELGIDKTILADKSVAFPDFLEATGSAAEGIIFTDIDFSSETNPDFWQKYNLKYNEDPNIFASQSYDTINILYQISAEKCGTNTNCIKDELYKVKNYQGASGLTSFDENGDAEKPLLIKVIKNGKSMPYEIPE